MAAKEYRAIATVNDGRSRTIAFATERSATDWAIASFNGGRWSSKQAEYRGHAINVATLAGSPLIEVIIVDLRTGEGSVLTAGSSKNLTISIPAPGNRTVGERSGPEEALLIR
jgi:hypothetical protein